MGEPGAHAVHAEAAGLAAYVPGAHRTHTRSLTPERQSAAVAYPWGGHTVQFLHTLSCHPRLGISGAKGGGKG